MSGKPEYTMTQEEARQAGSLVCPLCGQLGDAMSEHQFFMYDVLSIRCTPCLNFTIVGADHWILQPRVVRDRALLSPEKPHLHYLDSVGACKKYEAAHTAWNAQLEAMAKLVHQWKQNAPIFTDRESPLRSSRDIEFAAPVQTWRDRKPLL